MISVVMATYNGQEFLKQQLDSIAGQSVSPDQVVIIDDGSTDATVALVSDYMKEHQLANWSIAQNEANIGHYATFLKLLKEAKGDYIFFSDQDDVWHANKIEKMLASLQETDTQMVYCKSQYIDQNDQIIGQDPTSGLELEKSLNDLMKVWPSGYQIAVKKQVIDCIFDNQLETIKGMDFHDILVTFTSVLMGKVICLDQCLDQHRYHLLNATKTIESKSFNHSLQDRILDVNKYLGRYQAQLEIAQKIAPENLLAQKEIDSFILMTKLRKDLLTRFSFKTYKQLKQLLSYYNAKNTYIGDLIYSMRLNHFIAWGLNIKRNIMN